jgi:type IV secretion system protein VirD4
MNNPALAKAWKIGAALLALASIPLAMQLFLCVDVPRVPARCFEAADLRWWLWLWNYYQGTGEVPAAMLSIGATAIVGGTALIALCPFSAEPTHYGAATWARGLFALWRLGLLQSRGVVVGRVGGRLLIYAKPLSTLLLAPAGTGKTRGTIIPTVLAYPGSVIVHDPKGEVHDATAGHRAQLGRVLRLEWSAPDCSIAWNPLSPGNLPADPGERGNAIDRMAAVCIPGDDKEFWISAPRQALSTIILFNIYDAERVGAEACFNGVVRWLAASMKDADPRANDPVAMYLEHAAGVADIEDYPSRVGDGLRLLATYNYKTRADILGTINARLGIFLNESVAKVTARSDFSLSELRGNAGKPASLYIVVPQNDMAAFAPVTGILVEMASMMLLSRKPAKDEGTVLFVLDEARFLPPLDAIKDGPSIGRGYGVHYLICAQDYGQLRMVYGRDATDNIITNTAFKIVLAQNHPDTAEFISKTIGNRTRKRRSSSQQHGGKEFWKRGSVSDAWEGVPLVPAQDILSLPFGSQLVLVQSNLHMPVKARSPFYDEVRALRRLSRLRAPVLPFQSPQRP